MHPNDEFAANELGDCQRDQVVFLTEDGSVIRGYLYSSTAAITDVKAPAPREENE